MSEGQQQSLQTIKEGFDQAVKRKQLNRAVKVLANTVIANHILTASSGSMSEASWPELCAKPLTYVRTNLKMEHAAAFEPAFLQKLTSSASAAKSRKEGSQGSTATGESSSRAVSSTSTTDVVEPRGKRIRKLGSATSKT